MHADNESSETIEVFLNSLKERCPTVTVGAIMTDDGTLLLHPLNIILLA